MKRFRKNAKWYKKKQVHQHAKKVTYVKDLENIVHLVYTLKNSIQLLIVVDVKSQYAENINRNFV